MLTTILISILVSIKVSFAVQFCNDANVMIYSPGDNLFLIGNDKYWILVENNGKLVFKTNEKKNNGVVFPNTTSSLFSMSNFSQINSNTDQTVIGYFNVRHDLKTKPFDFMFLSHHLFQQSDPQRVENPFDWMLFANYSFTGMCYGGKQSDAKDKSCGYYRMPNNVTIDDIQRSVSFRFSLLDRGIAYLHNAFLIQTYNQSDQSVRKLVYMDTTLTSIRDQTMVDGIAFSVFDIDQEEPDLRLFERLKLVNPTLKVIGLFKALRLYVMIEPKNRSHIIYCSIFLRVNIDGKSVLLFNSYSKMA